MTQFKDKDWSRWSTSIRVACFRGLVILITAVLVAACEPSAQTPGQWLRGDIVETFPQDWAFTDEIGEIFVQVETPYFVPHSVTIWCVQVNGNLFIGAIDPETKSWVGWMEKNRNIRLKIDGKLYDVTASDTSDDATLAAVHSAYAKKYDLELPFTGKYASFRFWPIVPRS
jgi:hypothetical protein